MAEPNENEVKEPDVITDFAALVKKYKPKETSAENIAEHIRDTGSAVVFDDPEELARCLAEWHEKLAPTDRKKILERWFKKRGVDVSSELLATAGMSPAAKERAEAEKKTKEEKEKEGEAKFAIDTATGTIRAALAGEKALTWAEAENLSNRIKGERGGGDSTESPYIQNGEGNWHLNPKARITGIEMLAFNTIQRMQAGGQPVDPMTVLAQEAQRWSGIKQALGISETGGGDPKVAELLKQVTALTSEVKTLREQQLKDQFTGMQGTMDKMTTEIASLKAGMGEGRAAETRWGIVGKALDKMDTQMTGLRGDVKVAIITQRKGEYTPPPMSEEQRKKTGQNIKKAVEEEQRIRQLESELWNDL